MSTEDDLRRGGQAAAALAGLAAARAKQIAEQLLGGRGRVRPEPPSPQPRAPEPSAAPAGGARTKADVLVEEGKHAAAEVVGALRREATVIIDDLERLERALRGDVEHPPTTPAKKAPAKKAPARKAPARKAAAKKAPAQKTAAPRTAAKKTAPPVKKASAPAKKVSTGTNKVGTGTKKVGAVKAAKRQGGPAAPRGRG